MTGTVCTNMAKCLLMFTGVCYLVGPFTFKCQLGLIATSSYTGLLMIGLDPRPAVVVEDGNGNEISKTSFNHTQVKKKMILFESLIPSLGRTAVSLSAGGLSYVGIWVFSTYDHFDEIADASLTLFPASIILAVSVFMCVLGILACIAAFKSNKILLSVFFCLILLVFIGEVLAAVLGYVYRKKVEGIIEEDLTDALNNYNVTVYQEQIDYMQEEFKCCGVHNATDWRDSTYWKVNHTNTVPASCCKQDIGMNMTCIPTLGSKIIYNEGCLDKLNDEFRKNLMYIATSVVILAVVQFLALVSTCILVCRTKQEQQYLVLGEEIGGGLRV